MVASSSTGNAPAATASSPTNNSTTAQAAAATSSTTTNNASSTNSAAPNDANNSSSNTAAGQSTSTTNAPTADDPATRGRPYYEKLRRSLKQTLDKKRELDASMLAIETSIARVENAYLEETSAAGNIIKGFDNYIKASGTSGPTQGGASTGTATRRKGGISDSDRIFSRSSMAWVKKDEEPRVLVTNSGVGTVSSSATPSRSGTPGRGSVSARGTPAASAAGAGTKTAKSTKKKAAAAAAAAAVAATAEKEKKDDGDEERPAKRGKVSWGRD